MAMSIQHLLIFLIGILPPLFVVPVNIFNDYLFTMYREPKLYLVTALAWLIICVSSFKKSFVGNSVLAIACISLFSIFWAPVKEAVLYEVFQYITLAILAFALIEWFSKKRYRQLFSNGLLLGMTIVVFIGLSQWQGVSLAFLKPVGIEYPSTFGARHSAALAVGGVIFLIFTIIPRGYKKEYGFYCLFLIFIIYIFYILVLGSRTTYLGISLAFGAGLFLLLFFPNDILKRIRVPVCVILSAVILGMGASCIFKNSYVRTRIENTVSFIEHPSLIFQSERWVWWKNSIQMFSDNPMGVGAGNWGFLYPVYRQVGKSVYFNEKTQVRRTHNDYLQMLCEIGPIGLFIFLFMIFKTLNWTWIVYSRHGSLEAFFLFLQTISWIGFMLFDYPFEMPYQRFQLILLMVMAEGIYNEHLV